MADMWWRGAAIYQVYLRSFADGNGDGTGDLAGLRTKLSYLRELGIDAIWLNPWYPSPLADGGYDVVDYRAIAPEFGTLDEAERLIAEAHACDIRVIIDVVPNHSSTSSQWFLDALAAGPGSPERERFWFRDSPGEWSSIFGGSAWTQVPDGQWYLHLFAPEQPDLNWTNPDVHKEFHDVLRFWFDRGIDGIRIDSAGLLVKPDGLTGNYADLDEVHDIYRSWREIADEYDDRILIGEIWLPDQERLARYLRPDELHTAFNFEFLACSWSRDALYAVIDQTLATHAIVGAPATWLLSNHDVARVVTRFGRSITSWEHADRRDGVPSDLALGYRRARAAALLTMALPGGLYVYQGEELGLPEVDEIPPESRQDPIWRRSNGTVPGRDGCRVPLPWSGSQPPYGFGSSDRTWLPQPPDWQGLAVSAQSEDPSSMLSLYRHALWLRRARLGDGGLTWLDFGPSALAFARDSGLSCVVNFGAAPVGLPAGASIVLASDSLSGGELPPDTAVWYTLRGPEAHR